MNVAGTCASLTIQGIGVVTGQSGNALTVSGSVTGDGTLNGSTGTFNIGGSITVATFTAGTSTVVLNGSASQSVNAYTFNNLTVNNAAGVSLSGDATIGGTLTLTNGAVSTGAYKVNITNTANGAVVITGGSISGQIDRAIGLDDQNIFRFTNADTYIQPTSNHAAMTVSVKSFPGTPPTTNQGTPINRYYSITVPSALTATLRLAYLDSELNGIGESWLVAFRLLPNTAWTNEGGTPDPTNNYVEVTGVSNWSDWTLGDSRDPLPIQLASFSGSVVNGSSVVLEWTTITEVNNYGFYVQRRLLGEPNFSELPNNFIPGHGTTLEPQFYTWTEQNVAPGAYEYRLRQVDYNAAQNFTQPVEIVIESPMGVGGGAVPAVFELAQNYPNPFNPTTAINFSVDELNIATLKVYNVLGQEVAALFSGMATPGRAYVVNFDASSFGSGVYFYRLESGSKVEIRRMTLLK